MWDYFRKTKTIFTKTFYENFLTNFIKQFIVPKAPFFTFFVQKRFNKNNLFHSAKK